MDAFLVFQISTFVSDCSALKRPSFLMCSPPSLRSPSPVAFVQRAQFNISARGKQNLRLDV